MSSRKIYISAGMDEIVLKKLDDESMAEQRSRSFMLEKILRERYKMPFIESVTENTHANKA